MEGERNEKLGAAGAPLDLQMTEPEAKATTPTDEQWLDSLKADPAYAGIEVRKEFAKMNNWCAVNGKKPSRRRFINWLNRIEAPMKATASDLPRVNY